MAVPNEENINIKHGNWFKMIKIQDGEKSWLAEMSKLFICPTYLIQN